MINFFSSYFKQPEENQISVKSIKGEALKVKYSPSDTIKFLQEQIFQSDGVPVDQQRLYVNYGFRKCWQVQELTDSDELLIDRLKNASYVTLSLKLKKN